MSLLEGSRAKWTSASGKMVSRFATCSPCTSACIFRVQGAGCRVQGPALYKVNICTLHSECRVQMLTLQVQPRPWQSTQERRAVAPPGEGLYEA